MTEVILRNLLAYSEQIAVLIAAGAILLHFLKLTGAARLRCLQALLGVSLLIPLLQPWQTPLVKSTITISTRALGYVDQSAAPQTWTFPTYSVLAALIGAGVLVRLVLLILGLYRLGRYLEKGRFVPDALGAEKERVGVWPDVFVSDELKGPVTFGFLRPVILIPARWQNNETIAYHELIHVRRRDWVFTVIEEFVRAILWFHPAAWWLIAEIQLAREEVVDREAVQLTQSREQYIDTLLAIAEARAGLDLAPAPLFLKKRHLRQRVAALLKEVNMSRFRMRLSLSGFLALVAISGWIATRSFPLQAAPQAVRDSEGVQVEQDDSKLLHRAPVIYSREAIEKGIQGTIVLLLSLNDKGEVMDAQVINGPMELRRAAIESALKWHYNKEAGVPAKVQTAINFVLPEKKPAPQAHIVPQGISSTMVISGINLTALPPPLASKVSQELSVHLGDRVAITDLERAVSSLMAIDEHLRPMLVPGSDKESVVLTVGIDNQLKSADAEAPKRIRVGGNVQAVNLVTKVIPVYPPQAKQARIQGTVRFTATIGKDGTILNLDLISGHPLLADAARQAVQQWVYKPTLLNGDPVEVITQIDVNFTLSDDPPPAPPQQQQ